MDTSPTNSQKTSPISKDFIPSSETQNLPEPDSDNLNPTTGDQENHDGQEIEQPRGFLTNSIRDTLYSFIEGFSSAKKKKPTNLEDVEAVPMQLLSPAHSITIEAVKSATKEVEIIRIEEIQVQPEPITQEEFLTKEKETTNQNKEQLIENLINPAPQPETEQLNTITVTQIQENIEIPASEELPIQREEEQEEVHNEIQPVTHTAMEITTTVEPVTSNAMEIVTTVEPLPLVPHNSKTDAQTDAPSNQESAAMDIQCEPLVNQLMNNMEGVPSDETIEVTVEKTTVVTVTYEMEETIQQHTENQEPSVELKSIEGPQVQTEEQQQESDRMIEEQPKQITPPQTSNKSSELLNASSERVKSLFRDTVASASKKTESLQKSDSHKSQKSQIHNLQTIQPRILNLNQSKKPASKPEQQVHKIEFKKKAVTPNTNILQSKNNNLPAAGHNANQKKRKAGDAQIGRDDDNQLKKTKLNSFELSKTLGKSSIHQGPTVFKENNPTAPGPKKVNMKPSCVYCGQGLGDKKNVQTLSCLHKAHTKCYASSDKKKSSQCPACNSNSAIGGKFELLNSKVIPRTLC